MSQRTTPSFSTRARRTGLAGLAALALACSAVAFAQGPAGMGPGGMAAPEAPVPPGGPGLHVVGPELLQQIRAKLNLDTGQQVQFDYAATQGRLAREAARAEALKLRDATRAELAKPEPSLEAMAKLADDMHAKNQGAHKAVRAAWLKLYGTFRPDQKAVVKDYLTARMDRAEAMRQKMRGKQPPPGG